MAYTIRGEINDYNKPWPELPLAEWKDNYETLHMWTQIIGKIRLRLTPLVNHWWNVTLYVTPRGLTTSAIPYDDRLFQIDFDFISHLLIIETIDGSTKTIALRSRSVADFYQEVMAALNSLGMPVTIWTTPVEVLPTGIEMHWSVTRKWKYLLNSSLAANTTYLYSH